jgi:hypothetical protein
VILDIVRRSSQKMSHAEGKKNPIAKALTMLKGVAKDALPQV